MNEEEKKAIEFLKLAKELKIVLSCSFWDNGKFEFNKIQKQQFDIVLNLIEKQEKEIEELQEKNKLVETYKSYMLPKNVEFVIIQKKELEELKDIEADYIRRTESSNKVLLEQGYLSKDELRKIMASNTELSAYHKIKELLD